MPKQHPDHKDPLPEEVTPSSGAHKKKKYPKHLRITIRRYPFKYYPSFHVDGTDIGVWLMTNKLNELAKGDFYLFYNELVKGNNLKDLPIRFLHERPDQEVLEKLVSEGLVILEN